MRQDFCDDCRSSAPCCLSKQSTRNDRLFKDAKKKLNREVDLLEIVKHMRITRFLAQVLSTRKQRELIKFFQEYRLTSDESMSSESDHGLYESMGDTNTRLKGQELKLSTFSLDQEVE